MGVLWKEECERGREGEMGRLTAICSPKAFRLATLRRFLLKMHPRFAICEPEWSV